MIKDAKRFFEATYMHDAWEQFLNDMVDARECWRRTAEALSQMLDARLTMELRDKVIDHQKLIGARLVAIGRILDSFGQPTCQPRARRNSRNVAVIRREVRIAMQAATHVNSETVCYAFLQDWVELDEVSLAADFLHQLVAEKRHERESPSSPGEIRPPVGEHPMVAAF